MRMLIRTKGHQNRARKMRMLIRAKGHKPTFKKAWRNQYQNQNQIRMLIHHTCNKGTAWRNQFKKYGTDTNIQKSLEEHTDVSSDANVVSTHEDPVRGGGIYSNFDISSTPIPFESSGTPTYIQSPAQKVGQLCSNWEDSRESPAEKVGQLCSNWEDSRVITYTSDDHYSYYTEPKEAETMRNSTGAQEKQPTRIQKRRKRKAKQKAKRKANQKAGPGAAELAEPVAAEPVTTEPVAASGVCKGLGEVTVVDATVQQRDYEDPITKIVRYKTKFPPLLNDHYINQNNYNQNNDHVDSVTKPLVSDPQTFRPQTFLLQTLLPQNDAQPKNSNTAEVNREAKMEHSVSSQNLSKQKSNSESSILQNSSILQTLSSTQQKSTILQLEFLTADSSNNFSSRRDNTHSIISTQRSPTVTQRGFPKSPTVTQKSSTATTSLRPVLHTNLDSVRKPGLKPVVSTARLTETFNFRPQRFMGQQKDAQQTDMLYSQKNSEQNDGQHCVLHTSVPQNDVPQRNTNTADVNRDVENESFNDVQQRNTNTADANRDVGSFKPVVSARLTERLMGQQETTADVNRDVVCSVSFQDLSKQNDTADVKQDVGSVGYPKQIYTPVGSQFGLIWAIDGADWWASLSDPVIHIDSMIEYEWWASYWETLKLNHRDSGRH
jgi:hypothetical protein